MKYRKSDWSIVQEAEKDGLVVAMTSTIERNRTELNIRLSKYFRESVPNFNGIYDEDQAEDILYNINEYIEENKIDRHKLDFPYTSGSDIHLISITNNLQLKVIVVDEYYGSGDYSKYIAIEFFLINENTTKEDVNKLIEFVNEYLK